jgi:ABC-2 type transport system ATP-binding protein
VLLNESVMGICDKLLFTESDDRTLLQSSLYSAPSIQGNFLLLPNESGEDSEINLELLFNATLAVPERISALFHTKQTEL